MKLELTKITGTYTALVITILILGKVYGVW